MSETLNNYHFVVATPQNKEDFHKKSQISLFFDKANIENYTIAYKNREGLPKIYNKFLTEENRNKHLIFVHDDVLIEDLFWKEKLDIAFEKYDIIGLAGSKKCDLSSDIPAWHLMCERNNLVGEVSHSKDKQNWTTVFGPSDSRALILDGLFIAAKVSKLLDTNTKFDEDITFHHYDMTFSLNANKNKLKMGVYPVKVTHYGLGDSMNSDQWRQSSILFKQKYKI